MAQKACRICKFVLDSGSTCPKCGGKEFVDSFKGKLLVLDAEKSEIAQQLKVKDTGVYAVKLG